MTSKLRDKHARRIATGGFLDLKIKSMLLRKSDRILASSDLFEAHVSEILACGSRVDVVCNNVVNKLIFLVLSCLRHIILYILGAVLDLPLHLLEFDF